MCDEIGAEHPRRIHEKPAQSTAGVEREREVIGEKALALATCGAVHLVVGSDKPL
jgi:hypothetical protein